MPKMDSPKNVLGFTVQTNTVFRSGNWTNISFVVIHRLHTKLLNRTSPGFTVVFTSHVNHAALIRNMSSMGHTILI